MIVEQTKQFDQILKLHKRLTSAWVDYWQQYSSLNSWQFWLLIGMLVLPLIILYFFIDRKKALLIGFFGFNIHIWLAKFDEIAIGSGLWNFPYKIIPFLSTSLALDASLAPVAFMLVYQWTLNHNKNYYLYATGLCLFFSFLFRPSLSTFGLLFVAKGINYLYIFLGFISIMLVSKWITNIFLHFQKEQGPPYKSASIKLKFNLKDMFLVKQKAK